MSTIPNFLITGILAMLISLALIVWALWFVQRRHRGWVQMALAATKQANRATKKLPYRIASMTRGNDRTSTVNASLLA